MGKISLIFWLNFKGLLLHFQSTLNLGGIIELFSFLKSSIIFSTISSLLYSFSHFPPFDKGINIFIFELSLSSNDIDIFPPLFDISTDWFSGGDALNFWFSVLFSSIIEPFISGISSIFFSSFFSILFSLFFFFVFDECTGFFDSIC